MDRRLQGRVDPSDVLQDAYVDIATAFPTYVQNPQVSLYLWFRYMTGMRLMQIHRHHFGGTRGTSIHSRRFWAAECKFARASEAGQYEDALGGNSGWSSGDWDGDGEFTTGDLVAAFQDGGYEKGPRPTIATVPEPSSWFMLLLGFLTIVPLNSRDRQSSWFPNRQPS
jgi:hypothetical protein